MKRNNICALLLAVGGLFASCEKNVLDRPTETDLTLDQVFSSYRLASEFVNNIYSHRTDGYVYQQGAMLASATDEAKTSDLTAPINYLNTNAWSSVINPVGTWNECYAAIRKTNVFLQNAHKIEIALYGNPLQDDVLLNENGIALSAAEIKNRLIGEVLFLRAYYYYELIKRYGGVPLITKVYNFDEEVQERRSTVDQCVDFIIKDLDLAIQYLPLNYKNSNTAIHDGRASQAVAKALKAKVLLLAASPLHNSSNSVEKWKKAADANKEVIDLGYTLESSYANVFLNANSKEVIFSIKSTARNDVDRMQSPVGYEGGNGIINPTQNLVDAYEMIDGTPFSWSNPELAAKPYVNRDPRFYVTINYNGASWKGRPIESYTGGKDGEGVNKATLTGYYLRKFLDPSLDLLRNQTSNRNWVIIRLGEILLNYAEAQNEAVGPDLSVYKAVNQIRARAGMPPLPTGLSQVQMRERIRHERRIELAFEDHRFFDVRRWKTGTTEFNAPVYGVKIIKNNSTFTYEKRKVEDRTYLAKMDLFPIPQSEIVISKGKLEQNKDW